MADRLDEARRLLADAVGAVFPSAQLLVVDGGEAVLDEAAGDCTRATVFDLASLTKALCTTTLVMRHLDAGALSLDDEPRPGVPLGLLLSHAGGLPAWRPFYERLSGAPDPKRAIVEAARAEPLEAPPGSRSTRSGRRSASRRRSTPLPRRARRRKAGCAAWSTTTTRGRWGASP